MSYQTRDAEPEQYSKHLTELGENVSHIADKKRWAEDLLYRVRAIRKSKGSARLTELNRLEKEILNQLNPENNLEAIWKITNELNINFYEQLQQQQSRLSQNELDFCGLIRMNFSMKDIAVLKNITLKSVNMARYRLKKKLGLELEDDLNEFIQTF